MADNDTFERTLVDVMNDLKKGRVARPTGETLLERARRGALPVGGSVPEGVKTGEDAGASSVFPVSGGRGERKKIPLKRQNNV